MQSTKLTINGEEYTVKASTEAQVKEGVRQLKKSLKQLEKQKKEQDDAIQEKRS
jgi:cell division protein ZapA (FtsZ GTPase activity inhibitor)